VVAELVERLREESPFRSVRVVFCSCQPPLTRRERRHKPREWFVRALETALAGMARTFSPDVLLMACNTYSILYPETAFAKRSRVPFVGIVEAGLGLIRGYLGASPERRVLLFGTPITVDSGAYQRGAGPGRVVGQACPELHVNIEADGPAHPETTRAIAAFVTEGLGQLGTPPGPFAASLNCTHYDYALEGFREAFRERGAEPEAILDPNGELVKAFFAAAGRPSRPGAEVRVEVVDRASPTELYPAILPLLEQRSALVARAFRNATVMPGFLGPEG
jgi:hypothetical protein